MSYYGTTAITLKTGTRTRLAQTEPAGVSLPSEITATSGSAEIVRNGVPIGEPMVAVVTSGGVSLDSADVSERISTFLGDATIVWTLVGGDLLAYKTGIEVVESHYVSIAELRAFGGDADDFDKTDIYPDDALFSVRQAAEETIEADANRSWTRRARSYKTFFDGGLVELPDCDVDDLTDVFLGTDDVTDQVELVTDCQVSLQALSLWRGRLSISYEYGQEAAPAEIKRAVCKLAASMLRKGSRAENARGESADGIYTSFTLATGKEGSWSGIPEYDAAVQRFGRKRRVIA